MTTDGFKFLQLILQQAHPLIAIKNIATVDISKYSKLKNLFRYAQDITSYISNHVQRNLLFSDQEATHIFLLHLVDSRFKLAITKCEMNILHGTDIAVIYLVPAIAGTIDQIAPNISQPIPTPDTISSQNHCNSCIQ